MGSTSESGRRSTVSGASMTLRSTLMCDQRLNCWNTIARLVRMRIIWRGSAGRRWCPSPRQRTASPPNRISPAWLSSRRLRQRRSVDLPEPDEPISDTTLPAGTARDTPRST